MRRSLLLLLVLSTSVTAIAQEEDPRYAWVGTWVGSATLLDESRMEGAFVLGIGRFTPGHAPIPGDKSRRGFQTGWSNVTIFMLPHDYAEYGITITKDTLTMKPSQRFPYELRFEKKPGPFGEEMLTGSITIYGLLPNGDASIKGGYQAFAASRRTKELPNPLINY